MLTRTFRSLKAVLATIVLSACSTTGGSATPEPKYSIVRSDAPFEIRDYPELVVVSTPVEGGSRGAFGRLFDYISGANEGERKIAMTAPVLQPRKGAEISMTAPVLQTGQGGAAAQAMIFVLPEDFTADTAPLPTDPAVTLSTIPPRRVATVRYSGRFSESAFIEQRENLTGWMTQQGLQPIGPAESAGYDAPWTLPSYRRNEVLIPIAVQ